MHASEAGPKGPTDSELIDRLGGTVKTAELCQVRPQAVTQWRRAGIPQPRRMFLELARPDVFQPQGQAS